MKKIYTLILASAATAFTAAAADQVSVLSVSDNTLTPTLIMPESFETDTKAMLEDWYLKNYVILDYKPDDRPEGDFSDETLLERLGALPTDIEMPLNSAVRNTIQFYARKKQLVENMLGLSLYYMPIFEEALERHRMPLELRYLPVIESALVPNAVSRAGAAGLWQFMPATATGLGLEVNSLVDQRRDPYLASDAAARYLKQLYQTYGDWSLAIAAYNCGPGNVNKALRRAGDGKHDFWEIYPFLPAETRGYVPAFIAANYIMQYHKDHGISPVLAKRPVVTDTVHVSRRVHFDQISEVMDIPMAELRALNPQFRKDVIPGDIRPYSLVLPSLQAYAYIVNEDSIVNHNASRYARRGIVEPASGASVGRDSRGEYYDEEVIKYHKVRKGETLAKIAKKYGVTVSSIRKANKVGKSVKAGRTLKIKTVQRRYKPAAPAEQPKPVETAPVTASPVATDSITVPAAVADSTAAEGTASAVAAAFAAPEETVAEPAPEPAPAEKARKAEPKPKKEAASKAKPAKKQSSATTHTVRRGENLSKIAKRYGVTVAAIKKANNFAGDRVDVGQKIKIPAKK
ncbi:MAG: transglycosylase SLT domain-containing protein [Muribaculaceae bacterium]|nr:transglycosylase SLT domain-containing protein [Muribaculaceae bacterium]